MIALELRGLSAFQRGLRDAIANIDQTISFAYARWTLRVFEDLVKNTPQWSGDTAANWRYSIGSPDGTYQPIIGKAVHWKSGGFQTDMPEPLQRGDMAAVWAALDRAQDGPSPTWKDKVFFSNNTPIAGDLELQKDEVHIRPVNLVGGVVAMVSYTRAKWSNLPL